MAFAFPPPFWVRFQTGIDGGTDDILLKEEEEEEGKINWFRFRERTIAKEELGHGPVRKQESGKLNLVPKNVTQYEKYSHTYLQ